MSGNPNNVLELINKIIEIPCPTNSAEMKYRNERVDIDGNVIAVKEIKVSHLTVEEDVKEGQMPHVILYKGISTNNEDGIQYYDFEPFIEATCYVNGEMKNLDFAASSKKTGLHKRIEKSFGRGYIAPNTRKQLIAALKVFLVFIELFDLDFKNLTDAQYHMLICFIEGISATHGTITLELATKRGNESVNHILGFISGFIAACGGDNTVFKHSKQNYITGEVTETTNIYKNDSHDIAEDQYLAKEQYANLLDVIQKKAKKDNKPKWIGLTNRVICRLMGECGLRIGEVLAIASEDFFKNEEEGSWEIYLRCRISSKPDQLVKTAYKPKRRSEYKTEMYNELPYSTQYVWVPSDLASEIRTLITVTIGNRKWLQEKNLADIHGDADRVNEGSAMLTQYNWYIFRAGTGARLTQSTWSNRLRKFLNEAGLPLDVMTRGLRNLSHRFRHAYIMKLRLMEGKPEEAVMRLARLRSRETLSSYVIPTMSSIHQEVEYTDSQMYKDKINDTEKDK